MIKNKTKQVDLAFLSDILTTSEEGVLEISPDFAVRGFDHARGLLRDLERLYSVLPILSSDGYINDHKMNIPGVESLLRSFKLIDGEKPFYGSLKLNTICYNLILILISRLIIYIDKLLESDIDLTADVKNLRRGIVTMLHPSIANKLRNRGLSIFLNTFTGYDSEYELKSSLKMTNKLLSIQLATNTSLYLKVPIIDKDALKPTDFNINGKELWGEGSLTRKICKSIDKIIKEIRSELYTENDNLIEKLIEKLSVDERLKSTTIQGYLVYVYPKTTVDSLIKYVNEYSSDSLIKDSESMKEDDHKNALFNLITILNDLCGVDEVSSKMSACIENCVNKPLSRITYRFADGERLNIMVRRVLYLCMHESTADLSMLKDIETFKKSLDIVSRSYVTRGKPLTLKNCKCRVYIRDTVLIAPQGAKSLAAVGKIYGDEYEKVDVGDYRKGKMSLLLDKDKGLFEEYALMDSKITLKHANSMEEFNLTVDKLGVPLTISGIGQAYVLKEWSKQGYKGYQERKDIMVGNIISKLTPKEARSIKLSKYLVPYIAGYRGGRNEGLMYGVDRIKDETRAWYDYDLTSAYTTIMSILGHPDIEKATRVFDKKVKAMSRDDLLYNYIILDVDFKFPGSVKYPCIPTRVDDEIDIYPLKGRSVITGCEYLVASSMGCDLHVRDGVLIPFKKNKEGSEKVDILDYKAPYREIVKGLQRKRGKYLKKTFYNYMYKEIGNSIYGAIAMGISRRKGYDIKTGTHVAIEGGVLSNPILASYITGFARALIGECMHNIHMLKGRVVSVTTDGFITNLADLEDSLLSSEIVKHDCLNLYRKVREFLTTFDDCKSDKRGLEIKNVERLGLVSWRTRGQLGFTDGGITAATGFQTKFLDKELIIDMFIKTMNSDELSNTFDYVQTGLRSAMDIYKYGGHVIAKYKDRKHCLDYDDKRKIIHSDGEKFLDSSPWNTVKEYGNIRRLKEIVNKPRNRMFPNAAVCKSYKSYIETSVRGFIKACLSENKQNRYGIPKGVLKSYNEIINFVHGHEPACEVKLSVNGISQLKRRDTILRAVPRTVENERFIDYVKQYFKDFDSDSFFRELSNEAVRARKRGLIK